MFIADFCRMSASEDTAQVAEGSVAKEPIIKVEKAHTDDPTEVKALFDSINRARDGKEVFESILRLPKGNLWYRQGYCFNRLLHCLRDELKLLPETLSHIAAWGKLTSPQQAEVRDIVQSISETSKNHELITLKGAVLREKGTGLVVDLTLSEETIRVGKYCLHQ